MSTNNINKIIVKAFIIISWTCTTVDAVAQLNPKTNNFLIWGSGGYSRINNNAFSTKASGNAGMSIGSGYEMYFKNFLLKTGIELSHYSSKMSLNDTLLVVPMIDTEGILFNGSFTFKNTVDFQKITNVGIPIMLGYESPNGLYVAIGGKILFNITGRSKTTTDVTSTANYDNLIGDNNNGNLSNMPNHGLTNDLRSVNTSFQLHTILSGSFEAGYTFRNNTEISAVKDKPKIRLSLFYDYGFTPVNRNDQIDNIFTNTSKTDGYSPGIQSFLLHDIKSKKLNILYIGLKVTILFGIKKQACNCANE